MAIIPLILRTFMGLCPGSRMNPGYGHGAEKSDPFSPHIASAECKKGKALPPQRPLLGLVTASVLLGPYRWSQRPRQVLHAHQQRLFESFAQ
jgi:hypothetical protein